jgi:hypothetical protein
MSYMPVTCSLKKCKAHDELFVSRSRYGSFSESKRGPNYMVIACNNRQYWSDSQICFPFAPRTR